jgi:putative addiction module component (TIGR02574 family)
MTPMTTNDIARLSLAERIQLVEEIWDSIADEVAAMPLSDTHKSVLDERIAKLKNGTDKLSSWKEAKERVRKSL